MLSFGFLAAGLIAGFLIGWLYSRSSAAGGQQAVDSERATITAKLESAVQQREEMSQALNEERNKVVALTGRLSHAEADLRNMSTRLAEHKEEMETLQKKLHTEFENVANRILDEKSQKFTEQNRTNLDVILNPLKEKIKDFESKVDQAYKSEAEERNTLRGEIKNLMELNQRINEEAENLSRALKGDTKMQGNWGEFILEKILESSGLQKGREYDTQVSITDEEGKKSQPDVVVYLPDNKHIVVDSKVSLVAYENLVNASDEVSRARHMKDHLTSLRNHVRGLSEKSYQHLPGISSPDFVLLFVPIESSFGIAVQEDKELFSFAWDRRIIIVSPSTLLATLRTIASVWKQDRQTKNALEIAKVGGGLYDKFKGLIDDLLSVGQRMDSAQVAYKEAMTKLSTGQGNVVKRIEDLKKLGAKTTKALPENLLERAMDESVDQPDSLKP